jgi:hypothetical protein
MNGLNLGILSQSLGYLPDSIDVPWQNYGLCCRQDTFGQTFNLGKGGVDEN